MTVSKKIERLPRSSVKLTATIGKEDVRAHYDELLTDYSKNVQIPGFRKGKAPREVLVRKFGEALKSEALGRVIEKAIDSLFDESCPQEDRPLPYSTPRLEDEPSKLDLDTDMTFSLVYDAFPAVNVGPRKELEIEVPDAEITDEDLNRELEAIQDRNAIVLDREDDAPAAKNDVVTVNYGELNDQGEVIKDSEREDFVFTLGSGYNIYQFDDDLLGMKKGETKDIEKRFPDDYRDADLAGKTKKIRVALTALKEKKLPDLDDDLAQDVDEKFQTLEDLKADIRSRLNGALSRRLREMTMSKILEKIMEATVIELPESMIHLELDSRWRNLARRLNTDEGALEKMMEGSKIDGPSQGREAILEQWRPDVERALQSRLIVETLIREHALEASDEELEREIETQAADSGTSLEDLNKYYEPQHMREYLKEEIKERKLFDLLLADNTVKKGAKQRYLDLLPNNG